jgi:hypothetical protein
MNQTSSLLIAISLAWLACIIICVFERQIWHGNHRRRGGGGTIRRTAMKTFLTAILATMALAASAQGKIREKPEQVIARSQRDKDIVLIERGQEKGKFIVKVHYRDGAAVTHIFGSNGREIAMYSDAAKRLTRADIDEIQGVYHTLWYIEQVEKDFFKWKSASDLSMGLFRRDTHDSVFIYDLNKEAEIDLYVNSLQQDIAPKAIPVPKKPDAGLHRAETAQEEPNPLEQFAPPSSTPNDCYLVASEGLARLKPISHWARVAGFTITKNGQKTGGHAVVFSQAKPGDRIVMYDASGSIELPTQSHELDDLSNAVNQWNDTHSSTERIMGTRWVGAE